MNCPQAYSQCYPHLRNPIWNWPQEPLGESGLKLREVDQLLQQIKAVLKCKVKAITLQLHDGESYQVTTVAST